MRSEQLRNTTATAVSNERNSALELFTRVPRYRLLNLNTPVERLDRLRQAIPGAGILLDPVYSSKAAAGLLAYCRERRFKPTDRVLFWHTGGTLTLL